MNKLKWQKVTSRKESQKGQCGIYRLHIFDRNEQIQALYIGESSNLRLRYYDYHRPYEAKHEKKYPTDYRIASAIVSAKELEYFVDFELLDFDDYYGIKSSDLWLKCARQAIEQFEIYRAIKSNIKLLNKPFSFQF